MLGTVQGLRSLRVPPELRNCRSWRVELYNPYGEGGAFPPYGNSGTFDGVGLGTTGASSSGPLERFSQGIDYTGTWAVRLSLGSETTSSFDTCSQALPERAYEARFSLDLARADVEVPASPSASPSSVVTADPQEPSAAEKYNTPVDPGSAPGWTYPVVAVALVVAAGAALVGVRLLIRRRRQGW